MLTEIKAYSSWPSAPTLTLDPGGKVETDLFQIVDIDGLNPVKASVNTTPYGSIDGVSYVGSSILSRNIVLTIKPNPDWRDWTYESLRRLLYLYFIPKSVTRLVFYSDDMVPVEIYGVVEDVSGSMFSKEPTHQVSIICPDPHFTALDPTVVSGTNGVTAAFDYNGNVESGMILKVSHVSGTPTTIDVQLGNPKISYFGVNATVDINKYFEISSIPMRKYVQNVDINTGVIDNLLSEIYLQEGTLWPTLQPGENEIKVITDDGVQDYQLLFYERFGGL